MFTTHSSKTPDYFLYFGRASPLQPAVDYDSHSRYDVTPDYEFDARSGTWHRRPLSRDRFNNSKRRLIQDGTSTKSRHSKMTTGCHQFLRYANLLFTFIVFIAGAGILGLGIYILGSDYGAQQVSEVLGNDLYQIAAYVLIASGAVLVLISMCGCCGALRESRMMLGGFILAISLLILVLVAAAVIVFVFRQKMEGDIIHSMEDVLIEKYGVDLANNPQNRMVTDFWNWLQRDMKCCGVTGGLNSTTSWAIYRHSEWYKGFETGKPYVPQSCCDPEGDINVCTGITSLDGPPASGPPVTASMARNSNLYTVGCYDELVHFIQTHAVIIGISAIAAVVVMLFGLFFSVFLCRRLQNPSPYY